MTYPAASPVPRCGDIVYHTPSRETWLVAYADRETDVIAWAGWPNGQARLSDCALIYRTTDLEYACAAGIWKGLKDQRSARVVRDFSRFMDSLPRIPMINVRAI